MELKEVNRKETLAHLIRILELVDTYLI